MCPQSSVAHCCRPRALPVCSCCPLSAWDGHPALRLGHSCPGLNVLWPLAFAWLWYQIVGIPDEIPCPAHVCQCRCCHCHHTPQVPSAEPVLVGTLWLSSEVPFLDPPPWARHGSSSGQGLGFQRVWAGLTALTRISSVVLGGRGREGGVRIEV